MADDMEALERYALGALELTAPPAHAYFLATLSLGTALRERGECDEAVRVHSRAEADADEAGEAWFAARSTYSIALAELYRGNLEDALKFFARALGRFESIGDIESLIALHTYRYSIAVERADQVAAVMAIEALDRLAPLAMPGSMAASTPSRARASIKRGDPLGALAAALEGYEEATKVGDGHAAAECLEVAGKALIETGRVESGTSLLAAGQVMHPPEERRGTLMRWDRWREETFLEGREELGAEGFSRAWMRGSRTPIEQLLAEI
jgi:tetratricopeptide (TPR) repeat protein